MSNKVMWFLFALVGGLGVLLSIQDEKSWQACVAAHHCRAVGTREGQWVSGYSSNGHYVSSKERDQTIWRCDGGEEHIR